LASAADEPPPLSWIVVADSIRVYIANLSAEDRAGLAARIAQSGTWQVVSDPDWADVVLVSPEEWSRVSARPLSSRTSVDDPVESLTPREFEVLRLVADGLHNREIAERLRVTEHTVKFHLAAIFGKLGASTRTEAVRRGLRLRLIDI
jgi:DNA-binding NarL/FixJ family response regulator